MTIADDDEENNATADPHTCFLSIMQLEELSQGLDVFTTGFKRALSDPWQQSDLVQETNGQLTNLLKYITDISQAAEEASRAYDFTVVTDDAEERNGSRIVEETNEELLNPDLCPLKLADVTAVLSAVVDRSKVPQPISTKEFEVCLAVCRKCHDYIDLCLEKCTEMFKYFSKINESIKEYSDSLGHTPPDTERNQKLHKIIERQAGDSEKLSKAVNDFKAGLQQLNANIFKAEEMLQELWYRGEPETYRYTFPDGEDEITLCWIKADRRTMRQNMVDCFSNLDDKLELDFLEYHLAKPVILISKSGELLKKHKTEIVISIPLLHKAEFSTKEIVVKTRSSKEKLWRTTDYEKDEERNCIKISLRQFRNFAIFVLYRPKIFTYSVGKKGAIIRPDTNNHVTLAIPDGAVKNSVKINVQTVSGDQISVTALQDQYPQLLSTSLVVLLKLPDEIRKPVEVQMKLNKKESEDSHVYMIVHSKNGIWEPRTIKNSTSNPGTYTVLVTPKNDRVIALETRDDLKKEQAKFISEAIIQSLGEYIVNLLLLQHKKDPFRLYIDCCKREYTSERIRKGEERGFASNPLRCEMYLKENTEITIKASKEIQLDIPDNDEGNCIYFSTEIFRPKELFIKRTDSIDHGYINFLAKVRDIGTSELNLRRIKDSMNTEILLASIPVELTLSTESTSTNSNDSDDFTERFREVIRILANDISVLNDQKMLLLGLGISETDYMDLENKNKSPKYLLEDGLLLWRKKLWPEATMHRLITELDKRGHNQAADRLRKIRN